MKHQATRERLLRLLTPAQRDVFILRVDMELSYAEIGDKLGISPAAAQNRYYRGRDRVKKLSGTKIPLKAHNVLFCKRLRNR